MNKLILILGFLVFPFFGFSQNLENKEYNQIFENYYSVKIKGENVSQTGYYLVKNDQVLMDGKWILKLNGEKSLIGFYKEGSLQSLIVYEDGQVLRYSRHELDIAKLKAKILRLENSIVNNE